MGEKQDTGDRGDFHPVLLGLCNVFAQNDKCFAQNGVDVELGRQYA